MSIREDEQHICVNTVCEWYFIYIVCVLYDVHKGTRRCEIADLSNQIVDKIIIAT